MRVLTLLSGIPAVGKSTFIQNMGLGDYVISSDAIRKQLAGISYVWDPLHKQAKETIAFSADNNVWELLYQMTEAKMKQGSFIIIDAQNVTHDSQRQFRDMAKKYRYRVNVVDVQGDMSLETILGQNNNRLHTPSYVPESVIKRNYELRLNQLEQGKLNIGGTNLIHKDNLSETLIWRSTNLDAYDKINIIGDIHGCYQVLSKALPEINDNEYYIFVGDYFDRGLENDKVFNFLYKNKDNDNVVLLQGNHENHLVNFLNRTRQNKLFVAREFLRKTKPQLLSNPSITMKKLESFARALQDVFAFNYQGHEYFVNHGGILPEMLHIVDKGRYQIIQLDSKEFIQGFGGYDFNVDDLFINHVNQMNLPYQLTQVHGHRNSFLNYDVSSSIALEDSVEAGGHLCVLTIDKERTDYHRYKNDHYNKELISDPNLVVPLDNLSDKEIKGHLEKSKHIRTSSFKKDGRRYNAYNFTTEAFVDSLWNTLTLTARGLILDDVTGAIHARGYNKFFAIDENPASTMDKIKEKITYPVVAAIKENGYLGIMSSTDKSIQFYSKSGRTEYGNLFQTMFYQHMNAVGKSQNIKAIHELLQKNNVSVTFEVINIETDKHIVTYETSQLVILDVLSNDYKLTFHDDLKAKLVELSGLNKASETTLTNEAEFESFVENAQNEINTEGYVFKDANNYMFKLKNDDYRRIKMIRGTISVLARRGITSYEDYLSTRAKYKEVIDDDMKRVFEADMIVNEPDMYQIRKLLEKG